MEARKARNRRNLILLCLLCALCAFLFIRSQIKAQNTQIDLTNLHTGIVSTGSISTTLAGGGTLREQDGVAVSIPEGVEIASYLVRNGDLVTAGQALATVDRVSVMTCITDTQDKLDRVRTQLSELRDDNTASVIQCPAEGRVKAIYVEKDSPVQTVMQNQGALLVVSLDGHMVVSFPCDQALDASQTYTVILSDGTEKEGRLERQLDGVASILITDNGPALGDSVSIYADGQLLGSGELAIHTPWQALAYTGTVSAVHVKVNESVAKDRKLLTISRSVYEAEELRLHTLHQEYQDTLHTLFQLYADGAVVSPTAGCVQGIDEDRVRALSHTTGDTPLVFLAASTLPDLSDLPMPDNTPLPEEISVPDETSVLDETPAPEEMPVLNETPMLDETPLPEETPALDATPVPEETPIPDETLEPEETPALDETPTPEETPVPDEIPAPIALPEDTPDTTSLFRNQVGMLLTADTDSGWILLLQKDPISPDAYTSVHEIPIAKDTMTDPLRLQPGDVPLYDLPVDSDSQVEIHTEDIRPGDVLLFTFDGDKLLWALRIGHHELTDADLAAMIPQTPGDEETDTQLPDDLDISGLLGGGDMGGMDFSGIDLSGLLGGSAGYSSIPSYDYSAVGGLTGLDQMPQTTPAISSPTTQDILTLVPQEEMTLTISVDEWDIPAFSVGQTANIQVDALPGQSFSGTVRHVGTHYTRTSGHTKYDVELSLPREGDMLDGMTAVAVIDHEAYDSLLVIPVAALYDDSTSTFVYTGIDQKTGTLINPVSVTTGVSDGEQVAIVSGLQAGDIYWYK